MISERTVGKAMKQIGIKAQWIKPWTIITKDSDFSSELKKILDEQLLKGIAMRECMYWVVSFLDQERMVKSI